MLPQKVLTYPSSFHHPFQSQRPRLSIWFVKPESPSCILLTTSGEKEYLLPSIHEVGDAAVSHQDSTISGSPKQEGSLNVGKEKAKQKSTPMLSCLEENLLTHWGRERRMTVRSRIQRSTHVTNMQVQSREEPSEKRRKWEAGHQVGTISVSDKEIQPKRK